MVIARQLDTSHPALVTLAGEADAAGCEHIKDVLEELLESGCACSRVDLAGVSFMDTSGLRTVLEMRDQMDCQVVSVNPVVRRLFEVTGNDDILRESSEQCVPVQVDRGPITDCAAVVADLEINSFCVAAELRSGRIVRDRVAQMARTMAFSDEQVDEIKLAVGEAMTNAVRHGSLGLSKTVTIRCISTSDTLVVEITDDGPGFEPCETAEAPCEPSEGGMGILCMYQMVDEVSFDFSSGTTVTLVKHVRR